ncbi:hypothetical protein KFL_005300070 [Klebsormidium nitens]|uniref:Transmembrane protein n=1 Tax=Klebsormidium nitens TaxID=105231 RepID=A0A1Y1IFT2_KLENI|nr:hypothetical protein KFL_005300070 [Klebsormidium nitens]|eukprot:GAQ89503.1 hypothetical protein KFL_005300070 [Klebsormidium nitens]
MASFSTLVLFLTFALASGASPLNGASHEISSELRPGEDATLVLPARVRITPKWRILHPHKAFSVVHVNISAGPSVKAEYCLHQNESLEAGSCVAWGAKSGLLLKGIPRVETKSPFEPAFLDVNTSAKGLAGKHATVAVTEDFQPHRLIFFLLGHAFLLVAPLVSTSLAFYYGSGMMFGVILVAVFIAFQMSRLLPVNRKKAWNALILGSMLGLSTMVWDSIQSLLVGALRNLGLDQGAETLVFPFAVLIVLLIGAFLGFWLVRKFVLDATGSPDKDTATFVEWAIKLTAFLMLFLSSNDWVFQILLPLSGVVTIWGYKIVRARLSKAPEEPGISDDLDEMEIDVRTPSPSFDTWQQRKREHRRNSASSDLDIDHTAFPSSFQTPDKSKLHSAREVEEVSRQLTEKSLADLMKSPQFTEWLSSKATDRIQVSPLSARRNRTPQEIEKTASEGDSIVTKLKFW